jgi:pyrrolidone-carboxylate peptidase
MPRLTPHRRQATLRWAALVIPVAACLVAAQPGNAAPSAAPARSAPVASCHHTTATPTVEEQRLIAPAADGGPSVGAQILAAAGFDRLAGDFDAALCQATSLAAARSVVARHGTDLWNLAVGRAQGRVPVTGTLAGNDDRPLYWARLSMTLTLRHWQPAFPLKPSDRAGLEKLLEYSSRGITTTAFRGDAAHGHAGRTYRVFVTGFDPFFLDVDPRQGNPSGANALTLDGKVWTTADGDAFQVQTVVFPVRYADFDIGMVEDAFRPVFTRHTPSSADFYVTVSQGRPGAFDIEQYNGRRRSTTAPDNLNAWGGGTRTAPVVFPNVGPGPEFVATTVPGAQIYLAATGPFPVRLNQSVIDMTSAETGPVREATGPTTRSAIAVEGSGGGYLSNEVAYRASLLRDELGSGVYGGHIHTPVLEFGPTNTGQITDPVFEHNRDAMIAEFRTMLEAMPLR